MKGSSCVYYGNRNSVMKEQDIKAVLKQATELRANLCTAIDRSLIAHCSRPPLSSGAAELQDGDGDGDGDGDEYVYSPISASAAALEVRSLASIRDALIVLEEQLECLQSLPDQQRAEKKATLAELEESREILLRRLKQHRGRELAVIREAFSFVGESSDEYDSRLMRSYTMPARLIDPDVRHKIMGGVEVSIEDIRLYMNKSREKPHRSKRTHDERTRSRSLLSDIKSRFLTFLNRRLIKVSAKCLFAVAGAAAVLTLSNSVYGSNTRGGRKHASFTMRPKGAACPDNWATIQSGGQRCVLTEPFKEES